MEEHVDQEQQRDHGEQPDREEAGAARRPARPRPAAAARPAGPSRPRCRAAAGSPGRRRTTCPGRLAQRAGDAQVSPTVITPTRRPVTTAAARPPSTGRASSRVGVGGCLGWRSGARTSLWRCRRRRRHRVAGRRRPERGGRGLGSAAAGDLVGEAATEWARAARGRRSLGLGAGSGRRSGLGGRRARGRPRAAFFRRLRRRLSEGSSRDGPSLPRSSLPCGAVCQTVGRSRRWRHGPGSERIRALLMSREDIGGRADRI